MGVAAEVLGDQPAAGVFMKTGLGRLVSRRMYRPLIDEGATLTPLLQSLAQKPDLYCVASDVAEAAALTLRVVGGAQGRFWLSDKELLVLDHLSHGHSNKIIGRSLNISESTVKYHLKRVFAKLGVSSRDEAVLAARARGLNPLPN
jgi:LuxR family maltose regulon positive regulatory protein